MPGKYFSVTVYEMEMLYSYVYIIFQADIISMHALNVLCYCLFMSVSDVNKRCVSRVSNRQTTLQNK